MRLLLSLHHPQQVTGKLHSLVRNFRTGAFLYHFKGVIYMLGFIIGGVIGIVVGAVGMAVYFNLKWGGDGK